MQASKNIVYSSSRELFPLSKGRTDDPRRKCREEVGTKVWFNDDVRLAIASVSIPFGQRFITIEMASADMMVFEFPNLYLETIIEVVPSAAGPGATNTSQRISTLR